MPVFEFIFDNLGGTSVLQADGPVIPVKISPPPDRQQELLDRQLPIPAAFEGYALVDTGASNSGIHEEILTYFGIRSIDTLTILTPSGESISSMYPVIVSFPTLRIENHSLSEVFGMELGWETLDGKRIVMLLGRDILTDFLLLYNGKTNTFTLAY